MVSAQIWLNGKYPLNQRSRVTKLLVCHDIYREHEIFQNEIVPQFDLINTHYLTDSESLTGTLDLSSFPRLKKLMIKKQFISKLLLTNCHNLEEIYAEDNLLREIVLPRNAKKLNIISLVNNNFFAQDLSPFSQFTNLRFLHLGTNNNWRIINDVYNRWNGSLFHLRDLTELFELDINATDIDSGLEYLPTDNLFYFTCGEVGRVNSGVGNIKQLCGFDEEEATSNDIISNLIKIRRVNQVKQELQSQIEVQVNRLV
jgi:hypothetical protein